MRQPERIWLQWNCEEHDPDYGDPEPGDVTWSQEPVFSDDLEYVRADLTLTPETLERVREHVSKVDPSCSHSLSEETAFGKRWVEADAAWRYCNEASDAYELLRTILAEAQGEK